MTTKAADADESAANSAAVERLEERIHQLETLVEQYKAHSIGLERELDQLRTSPATGGGGGRTKEQWEELVQRASAVQSESADLRQREFFSMSFSFVL